MDNNKLESIFKDWVKARKDGLVSWNLFRNLFNLGPEGLRMLATFTEDNFASYLIGNIKTEDDLPYFYFKYLIKLKFGVDFDINEAVQHILDESLRHFLRGTLSFIQGNASLAEVAFEDSLKHESPSKLLPLHMITLKSGTALFILESVTLKKAAQVNIAMLRKIRKKNITNLKIHGLSLRQVKESMIQMLADDSSKYVARISDLDKSYIIEEISNNIDIKLSQLRSKDTKIDPNIPRASRWQNIIMIVDEDIEKVRIIAGNKSRKMHYSKLGFSKGKSGKIGKLWALLTYISDEKNSRAILSEMDIKELKPKISKIRGILKGCFDIYDDPFYKLSDIKYYKPKFELKRKADNSK